MQRFAAAGNAATLPASSLARAGRSSAAAAHCAILEQRSPTFPRLR
jgi:hypothetical protein